ncbi:hypothetical protein D1007_55420 [Hordeum vulgare]|nr:hypothetical protein D1007_55420 [Hordeum vulgare]
MTEEDWDARKQQRASGSSSSGGGKGKSPVKPKQQGGCKPASGHGGTDGSRGKKEGKCLYCNRLGQWKKDHRTRCKEEEERAKQGQAHLVRDDDEHHEGLTMVAVTMSVTNNIVAPQQVHLNEEKVHTEISPPGLWYFDTRATSHMVGNTCMFNTLDELM